MREQPQDAENKHKTSDEQKTTEVKEYAVDTVVNHKRTLDRFKLQVIIWYGFSTTDDMWEPVEISPHTSCIGIGGVYGSGKPQYITTQLPSRVSNCT